MTIIKTLAERLVLDLKAKQGKVTNNDRIVATNELEQFLKSNSLTDNEIIKKVEELNLRIITNGHFGPRGQTGSNFLKLTQAFLLLAKELRELIYSDYDYDITQIIRIMAAIVIDEIKKHQHNQVNLREATNRFSTTVLNDHSTAEDMVKSARDEKNFIMTFGLCGLLGKNANHFLTAIGSFLQQAQDVMEFIAQNQTQELAQTMPYEPSIIPEKAPAAIVTIEEDPLVTYMKMDAERSTLEDKIKDLLKEHYGTSMIARRWVSWVDKTYTSEIDLQNKCFFNEFKNDIDAFADLKKAIADYQAIIDNPGYQTYKTDRSIKNEQEGFKDTFYYNLKKERENSAPLPRSTHALDNLLELETQPLHSITDADEIELRSRMRKY